MLLQALPNGIGMGKGIQTSSSSSLGLLPVLREVGDIVDKRRTTLSNDQHRGGGDAPSSKNNNSSMVSSSLESISAGGNGKEEPASLPLIVALNCLPDCRLEQEALAGVAVIEHVSLGQVAEGKIEAAAAVLVHSLAYLPRAAQRRLQPWQLILSLSCADKAVDSALANELGLQLVHVDSGRAEEIADTVMALLLGLLRHTHLLASQGYASGGWLGTIHASCRGMRRCRGMVLGIVGTLASAYAVAIRSLAFRMNVIYFDPLEKKGGGEQSNKLFPPGVKKVETLKDLLSASDMVTLHCALTNDTVQLINADSLQYIKQGAVIVNTGSSYLIDDCALKQALNDGSVAGCALDGVEGPQWLEAWVRDIPNVLVLPRSADYSEEVWAEIRAKVVSVLCSFLVDGVIPTNAASEDDDDLQDIMWQEGHQDKSDKESLTRGGRNPDCQQLGDSSSGQELWHKQMFFQNADPLTLPEDSTMENMLGQGDVHHSHEKGGGKKGKRRSGRRKIQQPADAFAPQDQELNWVALPRDDRGASVSGRDSLVNSNSRFDSPADDKYKCGGETFGGQEGHPGGQSEDTLAIDKLKEGLVVALRMQSGPGYYVARQRGPGRGWCLDTMSNVTARDPAAQFLVVVRNRERIGLRSLAAGGKLLQANKKLEMVFVNHTFDVWESWMVDGANLADCSLTNSKFRSVNLDVSVEILAAVGEDDGVARWLHPGS